jgi:hypothetical protein
MVGRNAHTSYYKRNRNLQTVKGLIVVSLMALASGSRNPPQWGDLSHRVSATWLFSLLPFRPSGANRRIFQTLD